MILPISDPKLKILYKIWQKYSIANNCGLRYLLQLVTPVAEEKRGPCKVIAQALTIFKRSGLRPRIRT